jgi:fructose-bisphosphate aldolase class II/tagatose 1,6-diphosphate aldolase GatY/KbaY
MTDMLLRARDGKYAIGAFNILDYTSFKAVVETADELDAPVIVQTSVKTVKLWGYDAIASWYSELADKASVPVAIHVDHCTDIEVIKKCIDAGWSSVMIDASAKPFEENLKISREVVTLAKAANVSVEAELGEIGGVEDDIVVDEETAHLADPEKARIFCKKLDLAVFAPAIGTAHGVYKGEPKIAFDRIEEIARTTGVPLALHGGTGLSEEVFKRCISLGCAKVNISTLLKHTFINSFIEFKNENPEVYEPVKYIDHQINRLRSDIREKIILFGGAGKAG